MAEWRAYERVCGPLGPVRGDWQAARVAQHIAAAFSKKGRAPALDKCLWFELPGLRPVGREDDDEDDVVEVGGD